jgi:UDP-2,4-diacetamido-2,4,6-trideoxy-beta-L-altropyranose hydrolase
MRCLALAQAWQDAGGDSVFAMAQVTPALERRLLSEKMEVVHLDCQPGSREDAISVATLTHQRSAKWIVVDGYHFDAGYQRELKAASLQVLVMDDDGRCDFYVADLILNQNVHPGEILYVNREPYTRLLLGSRYVLLRREFDRWRDWKREIPDVARKILITMGGTDPDDLTAQALGAVMQAGLEGSESIVVVGGGNPHLTSLEQLAAQSRNSVRLLKDPSNVPELMAWAEIALIAAGGTLWELLFMGCSVVSYARNPVQAEIISRLSDEGVVRGLGDPRECSPAGVAAAVVELANSQERRTRFSKLSRERVDGRGAGRVLELLVAGGIGQL